MRKVEAFAPLIEEAFSNNQKFKMPVNGVSMLPFLNKTHYVVLDKPNNLKRNDMILYKRENGQYVLHRIFRVKKDHFQLIGDNQFYREYPIYENQVIGKVVSVIKGNKVDNLNSFKYKLYLFIWQFRVLRLLFFPFTRRKKIK